ncbi:MAG: hypothetical protein IJY42_03975 [Clostridia bacterium]|nr:hypothetical protein [Clostridia bacterium]
MGALWLNKQTDARLRYAEAMLALLRYSEQQIEGYLLSAPELLARCDPTLLYRCGWREEKPPASFEELSKCCPWEDREIGRLMQSFARDFGRQYRTQQLAECRRYIARLEERNHRLAADASGERRLHHTLCLTVAAIAVVLLW